MNDTLKGALTGGAVAGGGFLLVILIAATVIGVFASVVVLLLYSFRWGVFGYTPTVHDAIVSLFVLAIIGSGEA